MWTLLPPRHDAVRRTHCIIHNDAQSAFDCYDYYCRYPQTVAKSHFWIFLLCSHPNREIQDCYMAEWAEYYAVHAGTAFSGCSTSPRWAGTGWSSAEIFKIKFSPIQQLAHSPPERHRFCLTTTPIERSQWPLASVWERESLWLRRFRAWSNENSRKSPRDRLRITIVVVEVNATMPISVIDEQHQCNS